ncbi:DUF4013 domain-containing protein [Atopobium sp. oral taxon 416]|uniref:DUF4013 domain-containing protein n=1 Tax=Atopobium sp. oral taxon 416 TaxID=712157 RepID=UPI001BAC26F6|nr:DUF4013 domain-containing protein [Atopobium sp. oral taxon 416]QUC03470.1 DUF4013 domain-containing protein [Atopobium sp. oral taxon 416]
MAYTRDRYITRSWEMLSHDKGWYKPLLVIPLALVVPVVGYLGVQGYRFEWARLTAWGLDTYPKQERVSCGKCIRSGWRVFVAGLGYFLVALLIGMFIFPDNPKTTPGLFELALAAIWVTIECVACLRAVIYQRFSAGYQINRVWDMLKHDFGNLLVIAGFYFLGHVMAMGVGTLLALSIAASNLSSIGYALMGLMSGTYPGAILRMLLSVTSLAPGLILAAYAYGLLDNVIRMVSINAVGLWMRQFEVANWKGSGDPLPTAAADKKQAEAAPRNPQAENQELPQEETPANPVGEAVPVNLAETPQQAPDVRPQQTAEAGDKETQTATLPMPRPPEDTDHPQK